MQQDYTARIITYSIGTVKLLSNLDVDLKKIKQERPKLKYLTDMLWTGKGSYERKLYYKMRLFYCNFLDNSFLDGFRNVNS